jgi:hypothetical protein
LNFAVASIISVKIVQNLYIGFVVLKGAKRSTIQMECVKLIYIDLRGMVTCRHIYQYGKDILLDYYREAGEVENLDYEMGEY